jgi:hypothetical protein
VKDKAVKWYILVLFSVVVIFLVATIVRVRHLENHCIPSGGFYNAAQSTAMHLIGVGGLSCSEDGADGVAAQLVYDTKKTSTLPYKINGQSILQNIQAKGNKVVMSIAIHNVDPAYISQASLLKQEESSTCNNFSTVLDQGVMFEFNITDQDTGQNFNFDIEKADC